MELILHLVRLNLIGMDIALRNQVYMLTLAPKIHKLFEYFIFCSKLTPFDFLFRVL